jgi:hypothetical protein
MAGTVFVVKVRRIFRVEPTRFGRRAAAFAERQSMGAAAE